MSDTLHMLLQAADFSQHARLLTLALPTPNARFLVERFSGHEAVSKNFRFEIDCLSTQADFDINTLIGEELSLGILLPEGGHRVWHGFATETLHLGADGGFARYRIVLESALAYLALRQDWYLFQNLSSLDVVSRVLADYPHIAWSSEVSAALPIHPIITQAGESDADFICRILAADGLAFRFDHDQSAQAGDDAPAARHKLVIFDRMAQWPVCAQPTVRFHRLHATETTDTLTQFSELRQTTPNRAVLAAWEPRSLLAHAGQASTLIDLGALPPIEWHAAESHAQFLSTDHAQLSADITMAAHDAAARRFAATGSVRQLATGTVFNLTEHQRFTGEQAQFAVLAINHAAANNLGAAAAEILQQADVETGSYTQSTLCQMAATPFVPHRLPKPTIRPLTALVVGMENASTPVASERDHRIKVQFPWQRGEQPNTGGMPAEGQGKTGHAPGNLDAGVWLRLAEWLAGPDWGSHFLPRIGQEVMVDFLAGDCDQPVIVGQLYNGTDLPPFAAGHEAAANHPGVLSGWMSHNFAAGYNQWVLDDAPAQLRNRLSASEQATELSLGHLIHQPASSSVRGAWRGSGFEFRSDAWLALRAPEGILLSATARAGATSTQMDASEAVAQAKAAQETAKALSDASKAQGAQALNPAAQQAFIPAVDPARQGKFTAPIAGQASTSPDGQPVPKFEQPYLLAEAPADIAMASPKSVLRFAGQHLHATAQADLHIAATQTIAATSGSTASLFTHAGGIKNIAQAGSNTLQAHTGPLDILADQSLTITSSNDEIKVFAKDKIVLHAGQSAITLEGSNITFSCPGKFSAKGSSTAFLGPGSGNAELEILPNGLVTPDQHDQFFVLRNVNSGSPAKNRNFSIRHTDGNLLQGLTDGQGRSPLLDSATKSELLSVKILSET